MQLKAYRKEKAFGDLKETVFKAYIVQIRRPGEVQGYCHFRVLGISEYLFTTVLIKNQGSIIVGFRELLPGTESGW
jgi:hypothetical protein